MAEGQEIFWARLTAAEIQARATPATVVLIPVASIEQHGPHLAVGVDTVLATAVAERTARRLVAAGTPALVGLPKVAKPEPALTSSASAWPW